VRDILKMIIVLTIIGAVSGLALSLVYEGTKAPIEYQTIKFVKEPAVKKVLTGYDNDPIADRKKIRIGEDERGTPIELIIFPDKKGRSDLCGRPRGKRKGVWWAHRRDGGGKQERDSA